MCGFSTVSVIWFFRASFMFFMFSYFSYVSYFFCGNFLEWVMANFKSIAKLPLPWKHNLNVNQKKSKVQHTRIYCHNYCQFFFFFWFPKNKWIKNSQFIWYILEALKWPLLWQKRLTATVFFLQLQAKTRACSWGHKSNCFTCINIIYLLLLPW